MARWRSARFRGSRLAARRRLRDPEGAKPRRPSSAPIWISDIHLGTPGCNAELLLDFLKSIECETLYLVGDIIDAWQLRKGWYWPPQA
jgi:hypothetical protein